ncbi:MAG: GNAT family N-acetyltransferase [Actinobacteria bacterium]|uniref:Unannotated protein n=1 Tax=freshwater metagenome TaxID=449393 RepID=A0A6J7IAF8_9ZZZZ|nr:GNAT family protein [Actinomycetota bacterium]MSW47753.1 GNAT family N-acetyltransferase [Actinomycetota bacterium]MSX25178.1 GNAT family N-acetyltransferase [Actinomycetota bacterium]MSY46979.1 GNAT family N-acetyltransferase [Actinomycetota bacterium]MSY57554.1 GNAT family N-acetyltransferase [Actinomycetota bacterium]
MVILRPYRSEEFEEACRIRELTTLERVERFRARFEQSGQWHEHYLHLAIEADGVLVGDMQLRHCDFTMPEGALEMGLELLPEVRGKGIGTQALKEVARYAFAQGHHRVEGSTTEGNIGMRKSFEKAGWVFEGVLRNLFVEDGAPVDYYSYAITKFDG